jgi:hypothetical protein
MGLKGWTPMVYGGISSYEQTYPGGKVGHALRRNGDWAGFYDGNFVGCSSSLALVQQMVDTHAESLSADRGRPRWATPTE